MTPISASKQEIWTDKSLTRGDFILLVNSRKLWIGCCINFLFYKEDSKARRTFYGSSVNLECKNKGDIQVMLIPLYQIENYGKIQKKNVKLRFTCNQYLYHVLEDIDLSNSSVRNIIDQIKY